MSIRNHHRHAERRRRRRLGQALVETAIAAPLLVVLLLGGAQVGSIAYDQVSLDTAAREGARAGVAAPTSAVYSYVSSSAWYPGQNSYQCQAAVDGLIDFNGATPGLSATLTDSTPKDGTLTVAPASPNYQWCVTADNSVTSQTIVAQVGPVACGGYTGSVTIPVVNHGQLYS